MSKKVLTLLSVLIAAQVSGQAARAMMPVPADKAAKPAGVASTARINDSAKLEQLIQEGIDNTKSGNLEQAIEMFANASKLVEVEAN